ncbi:MAG: hypothetical protein CR991_07390 [Proteobacteria bacterium]|nr:MAG: hypothetical protein CR991_07390 [Pseudomonadota bacterium]
MNRDAILTSLQALDISIVIPTHNRPNFILRAVQSALQSCTAQGEVIVVDDRSRFPVAELLQTVSDPRLRVVRNDDAVGGAAYARNIGVKAATKELVFFLDDDDTFFSTYIESVLQATELPRADYGFGMDCLELEQSHTSTFVANTSCALLHPRREFRKCLGSTGAGFWVRRSIFLTLGGFDPQQVVDEDTDLCVRLIIAGSYCLFYKGYATLKYRNITITDSNLEKVKQLSFDTDVVVAMQCYARTFIKARPHFLPSSTAIWYLASRYIRRAMNAGHKLEASAFIKQQTSVCLKLKLSLFYYRKLFSNFLKK